jgi:hypothetical protein
MGNEYLKGSRSRLEAAMKELRRRGFFRAGPVARVVAFGAMLILAIVLGTAIVIGTFRDREIQRSERELESRVGLLAQQFDRQFREFESVQKAVAADMVPFAVAAFSDCSLLIRGP